MNWQKEWLLYRVMQIVKAILEVISDIADQKFTCFKFAIEVAKAGEHGRGFVVVADEVRKLAERTQSSLTEINSTINVIVQSILETSEQMGKNSKVVQSLSDKALFVKEKMDMLIYFDKETKQKVINILENLKKENGEIFFGHADLY